MKSTLSFLSGLKQSLLNVRELFSGKNKLDQTLLDELETQLILADVGVETTEMILDLLKEKLKSFTTFDETQVMQVFQQILIELLSPCEKTFVLDSAHRPNVILIVGINGAGKTTSLAKLARYYQLKGKRVMLAAGDTFRAAAIEQLQAWGKQHDIPVVAQQAGADTAAVIYDALQSAKARDIDLLLADTAGRLHTQNLLMEELSKIQRVIKRLDETAPHEVLLVLDATLGQNALKQVQQFQKAVNVSGLILTKLEGTAKGGIVFALAAQTKLPIRFIGVGEQIEDLQLFNTQQFVKALC